MSKLSCSFCNKGREQVKKLIAGPDGSNKPFICNECIDISYTVIHDVTPKTEDEVKLETLSPEEIKHQLDQYVIGQDNAKTVLSVAIYNHYKRINYEDSKALEKSNIMLIGPSGSGKTLLAKTVASLLDLPIVMADSTSLTEAGYIGGDVESIFDRLIKAANGDVAKAQKGIVFIDEIDKKANKSDNRSAKDVSGEGVQQSLLKLVEGDILQITTSHTKKSGMEETVDFDTTNVLFIVGGSFQGLNEIIQSRTNTGSSIGLGATLKSKNEDKYLREVEPEDLHKFGFIREFIGRFPMIVSFHELDESLLVRIMREPKNNILSQYITLFQIDGVELVFDDNYIHQVAKMCLKRKVGARGLRSVVEKSLTQVQFMLPRLSKEGVEKITIGQGGIAEYVYAKNAKRKESSD